MAISRSNTGKQLARPGKVKKVMHEFKVHALKSSSGAPVTNKKQAMAIAISEASRPTRTRRSRRPKKG